MIVKFLKPSASFSGVFYNTDKISRGKGELTAAVNFGILQGLNEIRPTDYTNYLKAISALNKGVSQPQLHVAISTAGRSHDKDQLTTIAIAWMEKMGYAKQPYLVVFHKDTDDNHVHIVSTRIDLDGRKISSGFERMRAVAAINQIMGQDENKEVQKDLEKAISYRFSTVAQFKLILEKQRYTIKDNDLIKFGKKLAVLDPSKIAFKTPDQHRANQLNAIFKKYSPKFDTASFAEYMKTKMGVELVFHAKDGKHAYGYTVIDHAQKNVYKGGAIMPLKELSGIANTPVNSNSQRQQPHNVYQNEHADVKFPLQQFQEESRENTYQQFSINIAKDVDDEAIHRRRRKKKTARTNQR